MFKKILQWSWNILSIVALAIIIVFYLLKRFAIEEIINLFRRDANLSDSNGSGNNGSGADRVDDSINGTRNSINRVDELVGEAGDNNSTTGKYNTEIKDRIGKLQRTNEWLRKKLEELQKRSKQKNK